MSTENRFDPRVTLVREKYFSLRPKPLEQWLWAAKVPGSAERVFWYHWDIGHQNGSWVSQVPIRIVAKECGLDVGTVTRAYQWLKGRGLIRRLDPGRTLARPPLPQRPRLLRRQRHIWQPGRPLRPRP